MKNDINDIGNLFKNSFEGYTANPSSTVWNGIKSKLWLSNFLNFGIASFNIYYAAIILSIITFTGFSIINNKSEITLDKTEEVKFESEADIRRWLICDENPQRVTSITQSQEINKPLLVDVNKISNIENTNIIEQTSFIDNSSVKQKANEKELKTNNEIIAKTINKSTTRKDVINSKNEYQDNVVKSIINSSGEIEEYKIIKDVKSVNKPIINHSTNELKTSNSILAEKTNMVKVSNNKDEDVYDTIYVTITDTIEVYDTIPYQEPKKKLKKKRKGQIEGLSVDVFTGIQNTFYSYTSDIELLRNNLNSSSSSDMSFALGTNVNYEINKWNIQTGISYMQLIEDFNYLEEISTIDTTGSFWEYHATGYSHSFDTVGYEFQIDTLNGDTFFVYVPMIIDSITTIFDSTKVYSTETNNSIKNYNIRNKYTYLNIPFMFGYSFYENKKMTLTGKIGGNIGILLNAKGKSFSVLDNKSVIDFNESNLPFIKTNFSWVVGLNMYYKIEKNLGLFIEPYFRGNLNSMLDTNHPVGLKADGIGLNLGFRFYL